MEDQPPPLTPPTPPASPAPEPAGPAKKGMSTGAKLLIGCAGGVAVLGLIAVVAAYFLFNAVGERAQQFAGGVERQAEAQRTLERLETEHRFERPSDGTVREAGARSFFAVTDDLWTEMRPWADELSDMALRMEERNEPSITDMVAGVRTMGRFVEGRAIFAETLDRHGVSPQEYLWTGLSLVRAYEELDRAEDRRTAPSANLRLAERHRAELAEIHRASSDGRPDRGAVFHMAVLWGMGDGSSWRAMGLDTLSSTFR